MILSGHIINNVDLELSNSKKNIFKIGFKNIMVFTPGTKYCQDIKGNNIEIYILFLI